jgi:hypothetical protein
MRIRIPVSLKLFFPAKKKLTSTYNEKYIILTFFFITIAFHFLLLVSVITGIRVVDPDWHSLIRIQKFIEFGSNASGSTTELELLKT